MHLRSLELASLIETVSAVDAPSLLVTGEAGAGKSWLLARLRDRLSAGADTAGADTTGTDPGVAPLVLTASGHAAEAQLPFAALHQLLEPLLDRLDTLVEPQRLALAGALALEVATPHERFAVAVGVKALLETAARERPVALIVDDLHWVDESTRQVLLFLARRLHGTGVSLVCATRPPVDIDVADAFDRRMSLTALDDAQSRELLRQRYPELGTIAAGRVLSLARGLPLALVQLTAELDPQQRRDEQPLPEVLPTGDRIEQLYATRIAALDESATMAALAVCLAPLDRDEAARVLTQLGLDATALDAPQRLGLIEVRGARFEPSHPTLAPVLIGAVTYEQRAAAHRALATVFAADVERVALHVWAEPGADSRRVASALDAAAQSAAARFAYPEAAEFWERAIAAASDSPKVPEWQAAAFEAYSRLGARAPALRLVEAMMASSDDAVQLARWQIDKLRLGFWTDADRSRDDRSVELAAAAADREPGVAAELVVTHAIELAVFGEFAAAAELLERAHAAGVIDRSRTDAAPSLVDEFIRVMLADDADLDLGSWRERMLRADPGTASGAFPFITLQLAWHGRTDDALALVAHFDAVAAAANVAGPRTTALAVEAVVDVVTGRWGAAADRFAECEQLCIDTGILGPLSYIRLRHAWLLAARGATDEALALCELAVPDAERTTPLFRHMLWCAQGLARLSAGELTEAIAVLDAAAELEERVGIVQPGYSSRFGDWFEARWRYRDPDVAGQRRALERFESRIHAVGNPATAIALRCRALLAPAADVDAAFGAALGAHDRLGDPYQAARTKLLYGMRLRRARRKADARGPLREAADAFDALGAFGWAAGARSELAACGERRPATAPGDPLAELTLRENEIARLIAAGLSSAAAAARLSVSVRTVDSHLASIYRKLGVHGRAELVEFVGR